MSKDDTVTYVNKIYKESNYSSFFEFFENYLLKFGIITIGYSAIEKSNKFSPYTNCKEKNIFNAKKGCSNISDQIHTSRKCQIINANYIILNIKWLNITDLESWGN